MRLLFVGASLIAFLPSTFIVGCADGDCDNTACNDACVAAGSASGACSSGDCQCMGGDGDADSDVDACNRGTLQGGCCDRYTDSIVQLRGYTGISESLTLEDSSLMTLDDLECLREVGRGVNITGGSSLTNIDGLHGLTSVGEVLRIAGCDQLQDLRGLNGLTTVEGGLFITGNSGLTELGLDSLTSVESLTITANPSLPTCEAAALQDQLLSHGWTGESLISGNDNEGSCE